MELLLHDFLSTRESSLQFCQGLSDEDFLLQAAHFTSPLKWHLAHTSWFFEELILVKFQPDYNIYDPSYGFLFNSYYNSLGKRIARDQRSLISKPTVREVIQYRKHIDLSITKLLQNNPPDEAIELLQLGINHEQQHFELMRTDLKYNFYANPSLPAKPGFQFELQKQSENNWITVESGVYHIGHKDSSFCYDNELNQHRVFLESYEIQDGLVTNREYLEFILDGGYQNPDYWLDEGWSWVKEYKIQKPIYWIHSNDSWQQYTLEGLIPLDKHEILAHISFYEAAAYAQYKGLRLPTEFEWEVASEKFNWGHLWEWTNSAYLPYPGFQIAPGPTGEYNGKFMVNQKVLRGSSVATSLGHSRKTYRNFFHPDARWQYTGIRLAR